MACVNSRPNGKRFQNTAVPLTDLVNGKLRRVLSSERLAHREI